MEPKKPECECLRIIHAHMNEIRDRNKFYEVMSERDFYQLQALLQVYSKISAYLGVE